MSRNCVLLCLFGISVYFVAGAIARRAIIGGDRAEEDQFKYQVSVQIADEGHWCGGGIIDNLHIVTAAHCVVENDGKWKKRPLSVLVRTNNLLKTHKPAEIIDVVKVFVPTEYTPTAVYPIGDIAILKLRKSLADHKHVEHLKLPPNKQANYARKTARIAGFGATKGRKNGQKVVFENEDHHLYYADTSVFTNSECSAVYPDNKISEQELCAKVKPRGTHTRGVCSGDSGSPLVHDGTTIGILSVSPTGCSERIQPGIYTRVSYYLQFIHDATHDKNNSDIRSHIVQH